MPVLVNKESGDAENLSNADAAKAISEQSHDVPLIDPKGQHVIAPYSEAAGLMQQGYRQLKTEELKGLLDYTKYSTPTEIAKTGAEGAASGLTFGLSTAAERALFGNEEEINKRREINPIAHGLGEAAGIGLGMLTGTGEAAVLERAGAYAGEKAAAALGTGLVGRIGSSAVKIAAENALFQAGDEASKMFASDPHQSLETAAANIGMSGLIGMGTGGAFKGGAELWNAGPGKKLTKLMTQIAENTDLTKKMPEEHSQFFNTFKNVPDESNGFKMPTMTNVLDTIIDNNIVSKAAKLALGKEAYEATKLSLYKFLGADGRIDAAGLRATALAAQAAIKGEQALSNASESVFGLSSKAIAMPENKHIEKLKDAVAKLSQDPQSMAGNDNKLQQYSPQHAEALGMINARAITYLNSIRPSTAPAMPLDSEVTPSSTQEAHYKAALTVAQQPLSVLKSIKEGSLTHQEMTHLQALYPALAARMTQKLFQDLATAKGDNMTIPYKTRVSLGMFMGKPLDSSMTPQAIMSNQGTGLMGEQQAPRATASKSQKLSKLPAGSQTPGQNRELRRSTGQ